MEMAKMTSKGQLTIPKEIREALGLETGDKVVFIENNGAFVLVKSSTLEIKTVNINSIKATMMFEDLPVTDAMLEYAKKRLAGQMTYKQIMRDISEKYKNA